MQIRFVMILIEPFSGDTAGPRKAYLKEAKTQRVKENLQHAVITSLAKKEKQEAFNEALTFVQNAY